MTTITGGLLIEQLFMKKKIINNSNNNDASLRDALSPGSPETPRRRRTLLQLHRLMQAIHNEETSVSIQPISRSKLVQQLWQQVQDDIESEEDYQWLQDQLNEACHQSLEEAKFDSNLVQKLFSVPDLDIPKYVNQEEALSKDYVLLRPFSFTRFTQVNRMQATQQQQLFQAIARLTNQIQPTSHLAAHGTVQRHSLDLVTVVDDSDTAQMLRQRRQLRFKSSSWQVAWGSLLLLIVVVLSMMLVQRTLTPNVACLGLRCQRRQEQPSVPDQAATEVPSVVNEELSNVKSVLNQRQGTMARHRRNAERRQSNYRYHENRQNIAKKLEERSCIVSAHGDCTPILHQPLEERQDWSILAETLDEESKHRASRYSKPYRKHNYRHNQASPAGKQQRQQRGDVVEPQGHDNESDPGLEHGENAKQGDEAEGGDSTEQEEPLIPQRSARGPSRSAHNSDNIECSDHNVRAFSQWGELDKLRRCLLLNPEWVNHVDENDWSAIHEASAAGWLEGVKFLIQAGASVRAVNNFDRTAYEEAFVELGPEHEVTKFLQRHEAEMHAAASSGQVEQGVLGTDTASTPSHHVQLNDESSSLTDKHASAVPRKGAEGVTLAANDLIGPDNCDLDRVESFAYFGNLVELRRCLTLHPELLNKVFDNGWTLMHYASQTGQVDVVEYLLQSGANINARNKHGYTALDLVIEHLGKDHPVTQILLRFTPQRQVVMHPSARAQQQEVNVAQSTETKSQKANQAAAVNAGQEVITETVSSSDADECSPEQIQWLVYSGDLHGLQRCLSLHPELISRADHFGWTPIHEAARAGHSNVVDYLMKVGANLDAKTVKNHTALDLAISLYGNEHEIVRKLRRHKPLLFAPNVLLVGVEAPYPVATPQDDTLTKTHKENETKKSEGNHDAGAKHSTPANDCSQEQTRLFVHAEDLDGLKRCLTLHPEYMNRGDDLGWTPIHEAARGGHSLILEYLLLSGANSSIKTKHGESALKLATDRHGKEHAVTQMLLKQTERNPNDSESKISIHGVEPVKITELSQSSSQDESPTAASDLRQDSSVASAGTKDTEDKTQNDNSTRSLEPDCVLFDFLMFASAGKLDDVKRCLTLHPAFLDQTNHIGWTAIHEAARSGHVETVEYLLQAGANKRLMTSAGHLPFDLARLVQGEDHAVTVLLQSALSQSNP
jgi:serine/threonine-protein phosphatase 6 regulatory ankyrin repeat subunit B